MHRKTFSLTTGSLSGPLKDYEPKWCFKEDKQAMAKRYENLSEVTLSGAEFGEAESFIQVAKQRSYTGRQPVIPSSLADTPCITLGVRGLLDTLNAVMGTSYTLDTSLSSFLRSSLAALRISSDATSLYLVFQSYISKNYDFGTVYAHLRPVWYEPSKIKDQLKLEALDRKMRRDALVKGRITDPVMPPRRVWDLYSNRVVPWWVAGEWPHAISHAWIDDRDRVNADTPINGHEWPVPVPKDVSLDLIRIEMLNLGAEYVWLDVLCLRQKGGPMEALRAEEWKVDVPTIGAVYEQAERVVVYFGGLGRPLLLNGSYKFDDNRCWFNRAWTLQEANRNYTMGGDTGDNSLSKVEIRERFRQQLASLEFMKWNTDRVFGLLSLMQNRVSTNRVDKVAALTYLLRSTTIPAYHENEDVEDAWMALVNTMEGTYRGVLFLLYPEPGNSKKRWTPSWGQVIAGEIPLTDGDRFVEVIDRDEETDADWYDGPCIEECYVQGFGGGDSEGKPRSVELERKQRLEELEKLQHMKGLEKKQLEGRQRLEVRDWQSQLGKSEKELRLEESERELRLGELERELRLGGLEGKLRWGEVIVEGPAGTRHVFKIAAPHRYPIPDGSYTLIGSRESWKEMGQYWVVGRRQKGCFEKVSVLRMTDRKERERLDCLGVAKVRARNYLV